MLWTIVKKELLSNLVSLRFALIFLLCCTLILVSAYTMRDKYENRLSEYSAALSMRRQELDKEGDEILDQIGFKGVKLDKPPTSLSTIVEGMEGAAGKFATVSIISEPTLDGGAGSDRVFAYFGTLDIMYIVRIVLSLVAILLTYDAISGEREEGTLKLALSNSVPRASMLLGKCIGGFITLLFPFLIPILIGLLILITSGSINFSGEDWGRLGLVLIVSLLYISTFLMLGLLVSSRTNRSSTSLMMLLFIWVIVVLAVPKVSMIIAGKMREVPSIQEVQSRKDATMVQLMKEAEEKVREYASKNIGDREGIKRIRDEAVASFSREQAKIQAEYEKKKEAQFRLAANISRVSPASAYTYAAMDLARTGFDRQERFLKSAAVYQEQMVEYFNEVREIPRGQMKFDPDRMPKLDFQEASLSDSWGTVWVDVLILFLFITCFFMIAYVGFVRSEVK